MTPALRPVTTYLGLLGATIALGLATRWAPSAFPALVARYGGDTLWAAMVFWCLALVRRAAPPSSVAAIALATAFAIEGSQLLHGPWLDAARATRAGALVLGQGFLWSDLLCYAVGVAVAATLDATLMRARRARGSRA